MTCRKFSFYYKGLNIVRQRQKAQKVGDVAAAFAKRLGQFFLRVAKAIHQLLETGRLFTAFRSAR